jgi:hypothetical protein
MTFMIILPLNVIEFFMEWSLILLKKLTVNQFAFIKTIIVIIIKGARVVSGTK